MKSRTSWPLTRTSKILKSLVLGQVHKKNSSVPVSGAQGGYLRPTALGSSASGPPGHDRHRKFDSGFIYQQAGRDSFHFPATLDCRALPLVRVTRHNSPGKTHSRLPERDSRPPISSESANTDRVVPTPRDRETHLQVLGDTRKRHVCDTVELPPSSVHVSSPGAKSPSGGCSVSRLAGDVSVHVPTFSPAQQGRAEITVHSSGRGDPRSPLVAVSTVVPTPTTSLCGTPVVSPIPSRSSVPAGPEVHLRRKVIPSARMEALMRHYKAAGFSDEASRLAAAPRRPSTNRMYDDRWCRFTRWAVGQGVDPLNPTAAQVASFLFDLFDTHGLSPRTIKQAPKNRPSDRPGRCLKVRGRIHIVPVTSDWTSDFSGYPSQNSVSKLTYFKTQSYLVLSLAL